MTRRQHLHLLPFVLAAAMLLLGACSGSGSGGGGGGSGDSRVASLAGAGSAGATPSPATSGDLEKQLADYVECLRKEGAEVPDPSVDADGNITFGRPAQGQTVDRDAIAEAQKVCGDLPEGLTSPEEMLDDPEFQDTALKFARCMRENGADVQDPDFSQTGPGGQGVNPFGDIDRDDPKVRAAITACQDIWNDVGIGPRGGGGN